MDETPSNSRPPRVEGRARIGLVTGSRPFAGLPTNPAELVLSDVHGLRFGDLEIVAVATPVSVRDLPELLPSLVRTYRPAFVMSLGLAVGAPVVRVETFGVNACHFAVPDNMGQRPTNGEPIDVAGPAGRAATWDARAIVDAILAQDIPARLSFHAGTHLCNFTLYSLLAALEAEGLRSPCGFLHLPLLPEQLVWMMRQPQAVATSAFGPDLELPTMELGAQVRAVKAVLGALARQATPSDAQDAPLSSP